MEDAFPLYGLVLVTYYCSYNMFKEFSSIALVIIGVHLVLPLAALESYRKSSLDIFLRKKEMMEY